MTLLDAANILLAATEAALEKPASVDEITLQLALEGDGDAN